MYTPMTYFHNYPEPFYPDWRREPHPGWGVRPVMAGPARVGVGQLVAAPAPGAAAARPSRLAQLRAALSRQQAAEDAAVADEEQDIEAWKQACLESGGQWDPVALACVAARPFPWLLVGAGVAAVGGVAAVAYNLGLFGGKR